MGERMILEGKTGFDYIDKMTAEERAEYIQEHTKYWQSLTMQERTQHWAAYYEMLSEKRRADTWKLMNVPDIEVRREFFNKDVPTVLETMVKDLEEEENSISNPAERAEYRRRADEVIQQATSVFRYYFKDKKDRDRER